MYKKEELVISILVMVFIISIITTVIAITLETINLGTSGSVNITFTSAGSDTTFYFNLSKNATIFSASMNVTGYEYDTGYGLQCPTNPSIDIGNDGDSSWNYTGEYCITNRTDDFSSEIQDFLWDCMQDEDGYCNVTINVSSKSEGIVELDDIDIALLKSL